MIRPTAKRGFTLIELLVVIAIIAILAAILFPVFAQAKLAAKKTADLSNMKQITLAVLMYTTDYDDYYMALESGDFSNWPASTQDWSSSHVLGPYTKNDGILVSPQDTFGTTQPYTFYGLTADRPTEPISYMPNSFTTFSNYNTSWGIQNPQGLMPVLPNFTNSETNVTNTTAVTFPANVILLANGNDEYYNYGYGCGVYLNNEVDYCYIFPGVYQDWLPIGIDFAVEGEGGFWGAMYNSWRKYGGGSNFSFSDGHAHFEHPSQVDNAKSWLANYQGN